MQQQRSLSEQTKKHQEVQNKCLQFQTNQFKRMLFGANRERFISNADVDQTTLLFDITQEPVTELRLS
jgi:hypothetical protein